MKIYNWKKWLFSIMLCCLFCCSVIQKPVQANPRLNKKQATMWVGDSIQLKLKRNKRKITWKSSKKSVATVSKKGKVKAKREGKAVITAKANGKKYKCKITVQKTRLSETSVSLSFGTKKTLRLVNPKYKVAWYSQNKKIAYVDKDVLYAKSVGDVIITAKCGGKEYSCKVKVDSGESDRLTESGIYTSKDKVALYLHTYGRLPGNYITRDRAKELGWNGGSLNDLAPGKCIGGDRYSNYEQTLPVKDGRIYYECDINTLGALTRGAERIVYSNDGLIFYTSDHYATFEQLY